MEVLRRSLSVFSSSRIFRAWIAFDNSLIFFSAAAILSSASDFAFSAFSILEELSLLSLVMSPIFILRVSMASPAQGVVISVILPAHTRTSSHFVLLLTFKLVTIWSLRGSRWLLL